MLLTEETITKSYVCLPGKEPVILPPLCRGSPAAAPIYSNPPGNQSVDHHNAFNSGIRKHTKNFSAT